MSFTQAKTEIEIAIENLSDFLNTPSEKRKEEEFLPLLKKFDEAMVNQENIKYLQSHPDLMMKAQQVNLAVIDVFAHTFSSMAKTAYESTNSEKITNVLNNTEIKNPMEEITKDLTDTYNLQSNAVIKHVLSQKNVDQSKLMIERYIALALKLTQEGNFYSASAIYSGLSESSVSRLIGSNEEGLSESSQQILHTLKSIYDPFEAAKKNRSEFISSHVGPKMATIDAITNKYESGIKGNLENIKFKKINYETLLKLAKQIDELNIDKEKNKKEIDELIKEYQNIVKVSLSLDEFKKLDADKAKKEGVTQEIARLESYLDFSNIGELKNKLNTEIENIEKEYEVLSETGKRLVENSLKSCYKNYSSSINPAHVSASLRQNIESGPIDKPYDKSLSLRSRETDVAQSQLSKSIPQLHESKNTSKLQLYFKDIIERVSALREEIKRDEKSDKVIEKYKKELAALESIIHKMHLRQYNPDFAVDFLDNEMRTNSKLYPKKTLDQLKIAKQNIQQETLSWALTSYSRTKNLNRIEEILRSNYSNPQMNYKIFNEFLEKNKKAKNDNKLMDLYSQVVEASSKKESIDLQAKQSEKEMQQSTPPEKPKGLDASGEYNVQIPVAPEVNPEHLATYQSLKKRIEKAENEFNQYSEYMPNEEQAKFSAELNSARRFAEEFYSEVWKMADGKNDDGSSKKWLMFCEANLTPLETKITSIQSQLAEEQRKRQLVKIADEIITTESLFSQDMKILADFIDKVKDKMPENVKKQLELMLIPYQNLASDLNHLDLAKSIKNDIERIEYQLKSMKTNLDVSINAKLISKLENKLIELKKLDQEHDNLINNPDPEASYQWAKKALSYICEQIKNGDTKFSEKTIKSLQACTLAYKDDLALITKLMSENKKFQEEWDKYKSTNTGVLFNVSDYLIKPAQRIMKYPTMLKEATKHMPMGDPLGREVNGALEAADKSVKLTNQTKKIHEQDEYKASITSVAKEIETIITKKKDPVVMIDAIIKKVSDENIDHEKFKTILIEVLLLRYQRDKDIPVPTTITALGSHSSYKDFKQCIDTLKFNERFHQQPGLQSNLGLFKSKPDTTLFDNLQKLVEVAGNDNRLKEPERIEKKI